MYRLKYVWLLSLILQAMETVSFQGSMPSKFRIIWSHPPCGITIAAMEYECSETHSRNHKIIWFASVCVLPLSFLTFLAQQRWLRKYDAPMIPELSETRWPAMICFCFPSTQITVGPSSYWIQTGVIHVRRTEIIAEKVSSLLFTVFKIRRKCRNIEFCQRIDTNVFRNSYEESTAHLQPIKPWLQKKLESRGSLSRYINRVHMIVTRTQNND